MINPGEKNSEINFKKVSAGISNKLLCTRCGTCSGVCPQGAIWRDKDYFPHLDEEKCTECGICGKTCPGGNFSTRQLQQAVFDTPSWPNDYCGHFQQSYAAHSTNEDVRQGGASGGVITELLLYLLEQKKIDGAIVTTIDKDNPTRAKSIIARSTEEIFAARQSKYIVYPVNDVFKLIQKEKGRFAYVGLPCQINGLRKWTIINKSIRDRIPYVIGLFCMTTFEIPIIDELYKIKGNPRKKLADFRFREGVWPGNICAIYQDKSMQKLHYSNFKDGAINYLTQLYAPYRCQLCTDGTSEFADISVADAWMRKKDKSYLYPSMSTVLLRTECGQDLFQSALKDNRVKAHKLDRKVVYETYRAIEKHKKINARIRAARRERKSKVPAYDEAMLKVSWQNRLQEIQSTLYQSLGRTKIVRLILIRLLLSRVMVPLIHIRKKIKESKAKAVE